MRLLLTVSLVKQEVICGTKKFGARARASPGAGHIRPHAGHIGPLWSLVGILQGTVSTHAPGRPQSSPGGTAWPAAPRAWLIDRDFGTTNMMFWHEG